MVVPADSNFATSTLSIHLTTPVADLKIILTLALVRQEVTVSAISSLDFH